MRKWHHSGPTTKPASLLRPQRTIAVVDGETGRPAHLCNLRQRLLVKPQGQCSPSVSNAALGDEFEVTLRDLI
jgi:hypothetical protein